MRNTSYELVDVVEQNISYFVAEQILLVFKKVDDIIVEKNV